jgi:uncharacterized repeat protein (TIGR04076 family)
LKSWEAGMGDLYEGIIFPVKATVLASAGKGCRVGHPVGQCWFLKGVPAGICSFAFYGIFPAYWTLHFGGSDPSENDPDRMQVTCPAAGCGAQFLVQRVSDEEAAQLAEAAKVITLDDLLKTVPLGLSRQVK